MTYSDPQPSVTIHHTCLPTSWEYLRHLAAELGDEYTFREQGEEPTPAPEAGKGGMAKEIELTGTIEDLRTLPKECAVFLIGHNAEPDAVDLLEELEIVHEIAQLVDDNTYSRVCQYMICCVNLLLPPDDVFFLQTAHSIYAQHRKFPEALALAIRLGDPALIREDFNTPGNPSRIGRLMKRQLAFLLAHAQIPIEWLRASSENPEEEIDIEDEIPEDLRECLSNTRLSSHFGDFGKELGVTDPKSLEDVNKTHLENTRPNALANVNSARGNLAGTFVNTFVNAGFGNDKLMVEAEEGNSWVYKNKDHGMMSATASLGLSLLWDTDLGLSHIDKYTYSFEEYMKADVAKGLIGEYVDNKSVPLKTSAIMGLGMAYAGSHRAQGEIHLYWCVSRQVFSVWVLIMRQPV
ncbi:hypothetical protein B0H11DRAFT_2325546 [Mycena galericulata]|nr:hypothetical protein B0H11DRAFT_2325546 [Mycena galericulata]